MKENFAVWVILAIPVALFIFIVVRAFMSGGEPADVAKIQHGVKDNVDLAARKNEEREERYAAEKWEKDLHKSLHTSREEEMFFALRVTKQQYEDLIDHETFEEMCDACLDDEELKDLKRARCMALVTTKAFFPADFEWRITKIRMRHAWGRLLGGPLSTSLLTLFAEIPLVIAGHFGLLFGPLAMIFAVCVIYLGPLAVLLYWFFGR